MAPKCWAYRKFSKRHSPLPVLKYGSVGLKCKYRGGDEATSKQACEDGSGEVAVITKHSRAPRGSVHTLGPRPCGSQKAWGVGREDRGILSFHLTTQPCSSPQGSTRAWCRPGTWDTWLCASKADMGLPPAGQAVLPRQAWVSRPLGRPWAAADECEQVPK